MLVTNDATLALGGTVLNIVGDLRFLVQPVMVIAFLLQHWCPPLPVRRRLGMGTAQDIKALLGNFSPLGQPGAGAQATVA